MHPIRISLAVLAFSLCGCADNPFDNANHEMVPLPGTAEPATVRNRFPESHGGLPLSPADREMSEPKPVLPPRQ